MYIISASGEKIELEPLRSEFYEVEDDLQIVVENSAIASPLVTAAARAFFSLETGRSTTRAAMSDRPAPAVLRETDTGLVRMVYHEIVVRFRPCAEEIHRKVTESVGFRLRRKSRFVQGEIGDQYIIADRDESSKRRSGLELIEIANQLRESDEVEFATPNFLSEFRRASPTTFRPEAWSLERIRAEAAWEITEGDPSISVAILDDGVDIEHPNLDGNIHRRPDSTETEDEFGRDFYVDSLQPDRDHFNPRPKIFHYPFNKMAGNDIHGTPCAGIVASIGRNGGSRGIAPNCRILPVKIFHADEMASDAAVAEAIRYAAFNSDVLSCSWSGGRNPDIDAAIADAGVIGRAGRGAPVFCAAGNGGVPRVASPARHPLSIAVGACTDRDVLAAYSNTGMEVDLVAPSNGGGRGVFTTDVSYPNRGFNVGDPALGGENGLHTNDFGGTSAATPLAAGVAALMLSINPDLDRDAIRDILRETTDKIGGPNTYSQTTGHSKQFGYGRVNAEKAVAAAAAAANT